MLELLQSPECSEWELSTPSRMVSWHRRGVALAGLGAEDQAKLIRCLPEDGMNGFFVALFVKKSDANSNSSDRINSVVDNSVDEDDDDNDDSDNDDNNSSNKVVITNTKKILQKKVVNKKAQKTKLTNIKPAPPAAKGGAKGVAKGSAEGKALTKKRKISEV